MEILITASIGLYTNCGEHYLQVIVDKNDKRNDYFIPISDAMAEEISKENNLEIE